VPTKDEIAAGLRQVSERLERLGPRILANLDRPLPTGTWTVHDALCHIAADSHAVEIWRQRVETGRRPGGDLSGDEYNEQQVSRRRPLPPEDVLAEIRAAFAADLQAIADMDAALLERPIPYRGATAPAAEMLRFYTGPHNQGHLDDVEKALGGS